MLTQLGLHLTSLVLGMMTVSALCMPTDHSSLLLMFHYLLFISGTIFIHSGRANMSYLNQ